MSLGKQLIRPYPEGWMIFRPPDRHAPMRRVKTIDPATALLKLPDDRGHIKMDEPIGLLQIDSFAEGIGAERKHWRAAAGTLRIEERQESLTTCGLLPLILPRPSGNQHNARPSTWKQRGNCLQTYGMPIEGESLATGLKKSIKQGGFGSLPVVGQAFQQANSLSER